MPVLYLLLETKYHIQRNFIIFSPDKYNVCTFEENQFSISLLFEPASILNLRLIENIEPPAYTERVNFIKASRIYRHLNGSLWSRDGKTMKYAERINMKAYPQPKVYLGCSAR